MTEQVIDHKERASEAFDMCAKQSSGVTEKIFGKVLGSLSVDDCCHPLSASSAASTRFLGEDDKVDKVSSSERPAFLFSVENLNFLVLVANPDMWDKIQTCLLDFICSDNFEVDSAELEAFGSAFATQFCVFLPQGAKQEENQSRLKSSTWFKMNIVNRFSELKGMDLAVTHPLTVQEVSPIVSQTVVRFQGSWIKDNSIYTIAGPRLRFPSGGSARLCALPGDRSFDITHSSGQVFAAALDTMGQSLKWSNSSVWHRTSELLARAPSDGRGLAPLTEDAVVLEEAPIGPPSLSAERGSPVVSLGPSKPQKPSIAATDMAQRLPDKGGAAVSPNLWGITARQCRALLDDVQMHGELHSSAVARDLGPEVVVPRTYGTGVGYALLSNLDGPREVQTLVVSSGDAPAAELLDVLWRSSVVADEVYFVDVLSLYVAEDGLGPAVSTQLQGGSVGPSGAAAPEEAPPAACGEAAGVEDACAEAETPFQAICASHGGRSAEIALRAVQARREADACRMRVCGVLAPLPALLAALTVVIFYGHIIYYGCVPEPNFGRCGARVAVEDLSWQTNSAWAWSKQWEADRATFTEGTRAAQRFVYVAAAAAAVLGVGLWLVLTRFWPRGGRVLVVHAAGASRCCGSHPGEGLSRFGLGRGSAHLINMAHRLGVPVEMASGAMMPCGLARKPRRRTAVTAAAASIAAPAAAEVPAAAAPDGSVGAAAPAAAAGEASTGPATLAAAEYNAPAPAAAGGVAAPATAEEQAHREAAEAAGGAAGAVAKADVEEEAAARILRAAVGRVRRSQLLTTVLWAVLLAVLRVADIQLALGGAWPWREVALCVAGSVLGVLLAVVLLFVAARCFRGKLPLAVGLLLPGLFICVGFAILALMVHFGLLLPAGGGTSEARWFGVVDLVTDEWARWVAGPDKCDVHCRRATTLFASMSQTLMAAGCATLTLVLGALLCPARLLRCGSRNIAAAIFTVTLILAVVLALIRAGVVARTGTRGPSSSDVLQLPQAQFSFTVAVYLATQAVARYGAPVCALLRLAALFGLTVRLPCAKPKPPRRLHAVAESEAEQGLATPTLLRLHVPPGLGSQGFRGVVALQGRRRPPAFVEPPSRLAGGGPAIHEKERSKDEPSAGFDHDGTFIVGVSEH